MSEFLPHETVESQPFWEACRQERLLLQRCDRCGRFQYYPRALCVHCAGVDLTYEQVSGRATVHAFSVVHRAPHPRFADRVPYVVALVTLDEGPQMMTNITGAPIDEIHVGQTVRVTFERVDDDVTLPMFTPEGAG